MVAAQIGHNDVEVGSFGVKIGGTIYYARILEPLVRMFYADLTSSNFIADFQPVLA